VAFFISHSCIGIKIMVFYLKTYSSYFKSGIGGAQLKVILLIYLLLY
jgi:hypothetical protein